MMGIVSQYYNHIFASVMFVKTISVKL